MDALPKTELHLHLEGSVMPETLIALAAKNNVDLPAYQTPWDLYEYGSSLEDFLEVYSLVCAAMVDEEDFQRTTYECLANCHKHGARYVELFFSPQAHFEYGVDYPTCLSGVLKGLEQARADFGIECQLIPGVNREKSPEDNTAFVQQIIDHSCEAVIGIGLDFFEAPYPPEIHREAFALAARHGLRLTAHAGEAGPADNVRKSVDILGCERIDHGYHIVDSPEMIADFASRDIVFTVCPSTTTITTHWQDLSDDSHAINLMHSGGLKLMVNSDDPPMLGTDLGNEYVILVEKMGFTLEQIKTLILQGVDAAWIDDETKIVWRRDWSLEIDQLFADYEREDMNSTA